MPAEDRMVLVVKDDSAKILVITSVEHMYPVIFHSTRPTVDLQAVATDSVKHPAYGKKTYL